MITQPQLPSKKQGRARETLFRVAYQQQGHLIQVADYKANMIISICTMIISAIIAIIGYGVVTGRGESYVPLLIAPVLMIVLSCLISLIIAIRAASPKFISGKNEPGVEHRSSLLYFGVIADLDQQEYVGKMKAMLSDEDVIFEQMTLDIYNQGIVLRKKYNLLRDAYHVLLFGFVLSVTVFLVTFLFSYML